MRKSSRYKTPRRPLRRIKPALETLDSENNTCSNADLSNNESELDSLADINCYWNADDLDGPGENSWQPDDRLNTISKPLRSDVINLLTSFGLDDHLIFITANNDTSPEDAQKRKTTAVNRLIDFLEWVSDNCELSWDEGIENDEYVKLVLDQAILKLAVMLPGYVSLLSGMMILIINELLNLTTNLMKPIGGTMQRAPETVRSILMDIQSSLIKWYIPNSITLGRPNDVTMSSAAALTVFQTCLSKTSRQIKRLKKTSPSYQQRYFNHNLYV